MCGRYNLFQPINEVAARFGAVRYPSDVLPRYNIAPTQTLPIVVREAGTSNIALELSRWGLVPSWAKDVNIGSKMINARAETVAIKPAYRNLIRRRRCIIPCDGFYEWQTKEHGWDGKGPKVPMLIHHPDSQLFGLAGIYDKWRTPEGTWLQTYSIITVESNRDMSVLHDRMPAILGREAERFWLDNTVDDVPLLQSLLVTYDGPLDIYPVSTEINKPSFDDVSALLPVPRMSIPTLF